MFTLLLTTSLILPAHAAKKDKDKKKKKGAEPTEQVVVAPPDPTSETYLPNGLVRVEFDFNMNGRPEVFKYFDERGGQRILRKQETDVNADGQLDIITIYNPSGVVVLEEMDGDFDGRFDITDHYASGVLDKSEVDTDYDGRADVFTFYQRGPDGTVVPKREERDTDGDGSVDFWIELDADGNAVNHGREGDGSMDLVPAGPAAEGDAAPEEAPAKE